MSELAMLGGRPSFPDGVPFVRPPTPPLARVTELLEPSWTRGILTNGPLVRHLEDATAEILGVEHVVAVSSCTTGLMLTIRALVPRGDIVLPSFTFSASAHAIAWNGCEPRFAECDRAGFQLSIDDAQRRGAGAAGFLATHVFGAPCAAERVEAMAAERGVPAIFDAAHAFGALRRGVPVARFGDAAVFSLTPTKPLVAGEGGLVATMRADLAEQVRLGRDYGNPGDYNTQFVGLNGRMSEMHAATALASLEDFAANQVLRNALVGLYADLLTRIPGIRMQAVDADNVSTYKDLTIAVDADTFGVGREALRRALRDEGVDTRSYFDPPVHRQTAYARAHPVSLPATDQVASSVLSLPIYPSLTASTVQRICELVALVHERAEEIRAYQAA